MNTRKLALSVFALTLSLAAAGCGAGTTGPGAPPASGTASNDLQTLAASPEVLLLDVRTPAEFAAGHVEGAVNVPVGETARMTELIGRKDRPVVLHCRSGNRSGQAMSTLAAAGFTRLANGGSYEATARALGKRVVN